MALAPGPQRHGSGPDRRTRVEAVPAASFGELALPHLDAAYTLARHLVRDATVAEDVVQDAFVKALTYFGSFRGENFRAWLLRIVRNAAYDQLRASRGGIDVSLDADDAFDPPDPAEGPEATLSRKQDARRLADALAALPVTLRECLVLREIEELSYHEIGQVTGVPIGTVMSRLWRARRLLLQTRAEAAP